MDRKQLAAERALGKELSQARTRLASEKRRAQSAAGVLGSGLATSTSAGRQMLAAPDKKYAATLASVRKRAMSFK